MGKLLILLVLLVLTGCHGPQTADTEPLPTQPPETVAATQPPTEAPTEAPTEVHTEPADPLTQILDTMTTEEKVGQLFLARYPGDSGAEDAAAYHLGGYILFAQDFSGETPESITAELAQVQAGAKIPLLMAVDEEGGTVTRISCHSSFRERRFSAPRKLYAAGGLDALLAEEAEKCQLLSSLGINVNMAPVCDITTDPNAFMYRRSLGLDPQETASVIAATVKTMSACGVGSVLKHFPGYGNNTDTHTGIAVDSRSLAKLSQEDLVPFRGGIEAGCGAILVSHTIVEALDPELPASLSPKVIRYLRLGMDFDGVIVTDDLVMDAITQSYGAGEAAVLAVLAGNDLLCSSEYSLQYAAVLDAVNTGRIPMEQLEASVLRVLRWKQDLGLL